MDSMLVTYSCVNSLPVSEQLKQVSYTINSHSDSKIHACCMKLCIAACVTADRFAVGITAHINQDVALYTDADVLFYREFNPCKLDLPEVMAIGPEMDRVASSWSELNWNAGVLLINLKGFAAVLPNMIEWANSRHWDFVAADQAMLNEYFPAVYGRPLDSLPEIYNWKGYWGCNPALVRPPVLLCLCLYVRGSVHLSVWMVIHQFIHQSLMHLFICCSFCIGAREHQAN